MTLLSSFQEIESCPFKKLEYELCGKDTEGTKAARKSARVLIFSAKDRVEERVSGLDAGVVSLYTREYFELVRERLAEGGINTYWLPVHSLSPGETRSILAAYCQVFPDCSLWTTARLNWMLMGSRGGRWSRSEAEFSRQWHDARVLPELRALGIEKPEQMGAMFMADSDTPRAHLSYIAKRRRYDSDRRVWDM